MQQRTYDREHVCRSYKEPKSHCNALHFDILISDAVHTSSNQVRPRIGWLLLNPNLTTIATHLIDPS